MASSREEQISLGSSDTALATKKCLQVAQHRQCGVDLEGDATWPGHQVVRAMSKRACVHQHMAIVAIHVTELPNTVMTNPAVELNDQRLFVVVDVSLVRET